MPDKSIKDKALDKMGKYTFATGGQPSESADTFNDYVDMLISSQQDDQYVQPQQATMQEEQDSDYIKGLREFDQEENSNSFEKMNEKLNSFMSILDEKLAEVGTQNEEIDWFSSMDGNDAIAGMYNTQGASTPATSQQGGWPVPITGMNSYNPSELPFTSTGEQGLKNIGPRGMEIATTVSNMLGYKPAFNSIYRTKEQNDQLIKEGKPAAKNSHHLTGNAVDIKPADWNKLSAAHKAELKKKYDIIFHNNHYHVEPK
jgi:hypothetical protein